MTTEDLIIALARASEPAKPTGFIRRLAIALVLGLLVGLLALKFTMGFRPDIGVAAPIVAMKAGLSALIATCAVGLAIKLARPLADKDARLGRMGRPLVTLACMSLSIGFISLFATGPNHRFEAFMGHGFPWCVILIPLFGLPSAALLTWVFRDGAPTRLAYAGASVGAVSGGIGAIVYAMYCPIDSISFVTIWYVAGIGVASAVGAWLGVKLLRW